MNTPKRRLSLEHRRELAETLTDAVLVPEVGRLAPAARPGFQVHFVERERDMMAIGGRLLADAGPDFASFAQVPAASLTQVLEESDVVSLHLPLTDQTRHLVSGEVLRRMRPDAVIVNVSRGGLVDESAPAKALRSGHIAGAALDVFAEEPLPEGHPLRDAPNVILTPHIARRSTTSLGALQDGAVARARRALSGEPLIDRV